MSQLSKGSAALFDSLEEERIRAQTLWQLIANDAEFAAKASTYSGRFPIPAWSGLLGSSFRIHPAMEYDVMAFDGSQVYPDRHQGIACFLINIGQAHFSYGESVGKVYFDSTPHVTFGGELNPELFTPEFVNAQRTHHELSVGLDYMRENCKNRSQSLFLFDGSLIFWHLQTPENSAYQDFLPKYLALIDQFFNNQFLMSGYISKSKSKELVSLLKIAAELNNENAQFMHLVDGDIGDFYLKEGHRSIIFANNSSIVKSYPEHAKPYFFYLNAGDEIARVEIPAWVAIDKQKIDGVAAIIYDQVIKGYGYPISLAEAHEQAVIANPDREFFFYLLQTICNHKKPTYNASLKSMKKRRPSI